VDVCDGSEVGVVCRAVYGFCWWMDVGVGADCCAESEKRENVEEVVFV
jgi:hypothetical protein